MGFGAQVVYHVLKGYMTGTYCMSSEYMRIVVVDTHPYLQNTSLNMHSMCACVVLCAFWWLFDSFDWGVPLNSDDSPLSPGTHPLRF